MAAVTLMRKRKDRTGLALALIAFAVALGAVLTVTLGTDVLLAYMVNLPAIVFIWYSRKEETFADRVEYDEAAGGVAPRRELGLQT